MKALASTKLRNQILALNPEAVVTLKNVRVNGALFGCNGFVSTPDGSKHVYVCTDHNHGLSYDKALYRTAKHTKDYTGGSNNFSKYASLAESVVDLLGK